MGKAYFKVLFRDVLHFSAASEGERGIPFPSCGYFIAERSGHLVITRSRHVVIGFDIYWLEFVIVIEYVTESGIAALKGGRLVQKWQFLA